MFISKTLGILTAVAFTGGMIGFANADVINVNVTDGNTPYTGLAAYAGDPAGSNAVWNNVPIPYQSVTAANPLTVNSLLDSGGTATNINLTISPIASSGTYLNRYNDNGSNSGLVPNPMALMEGYIFDGFLATLSNVPQGGYDMYVYGVGNNANQGGTLTVSTPEGYSTSGTTLANDVNFRNIDDTGNPDFTGTDNSGETYVILPVTVGASDQISLTGPYLNGFQLVSTTTPEPASLLLLAVGGAGLLLVSRRYRAERS